MRVSEQVTFVFKSVAAKSSLKSGVDVSQKQEAATQKKLRLRNKIIGDIINGERHYVTDLQSLVRDYYEPIKLLHGRNKPARRRDWVAQVGNTFRLAIYFHLLHAP